jgi:nicotinamidase/pyrazinamidase
MNRALLLVDLQNDFMPGGSLAVTDGDAVVPVANRLMGRYPLVVATQDWHPADHGSFAANHPGADLYALADLNGLEQVLWPVHCVQGSEGAAFHQDLDQKPLTKVFPKGTDPGVDSYSGFWDNGQRHASGLADWLREQAVDGVDILGLATDFCVRATSLDAVREGFATRLIVPGCRAVNLQPEDGEQALAEMREAGVELLHSEAEAGA